MPPPITVNIPVLSRHDKDVLRQVIDAHRRAPKAAPGRTGAQPDAAGETPDVYLSISPAGGIAAYNGILVPLQMDVYRITPDGIISAGFFLPVVYNLGDAVDGGDLIVVERDKFGTWFIVGTSLAPFTCVCIYDTCRGRYRYFNLPASWEQDFPCDYVLSGTGTHHVPPTTGTGTHAGLGCCLPDQPQQWCISGIGALLEFFGNIAGSDLSGLRNLTYSATDSSPASFLFVWTSTIARVSGGTLQILMTCSVTGIRVRIYTYTTHGIIFADYQGPAEINCTGANLFTLLTCDSSGGTDEWFCPEAPATLTVAPGTCTGTTGTGTTPAVPPTVNFAQNDLCTTATSLVINGTGFSPVAALNSVTFNLGAAGHVTAATTTQLTIVIDTAPTSVGALTAQVTTPNGTSAPPVQVATVVVCDACTCSPLPPTIYACVRAFSGNTELYCLNFALNQDATTGVYLGSGIDGAFIMDANLFCLTASGYVFRDRNTDIEYPLAIYACNPLRLTGGNSDLVIVITDHFDSGCCNNTGTGTGTGVSCIGGADCAGAVEMAIDADFSCTIPDGATWWYKVPIPGAFALLFIKTVSMDSGMAATSTWQHPDCVASTVALPDNGICSQFSDGAGGFTYIKVANSTGTAQPFTLRVGNGTCP